MKRLLEWFVILVALLFITVGLWKVAYPLSEQPLTAIERKMYAEQAEAKRLRTAYYNRISMVINEATYPDDEFVHKMVRDNHQWCGTQLNDTAQKLEAVSADLLKTRSELERIKSILLQVKP
jgi:predicted ATPase